MTDKPPTSNLTGNLPPTNPNDLKSALEYQIDIVLRLEEERLLLLKENKMQREKIRELTARVELSAFTAKKPQIQEKNVQTDVQETQEGSCQTEEAIEEQDPLEYSKSQKKTVIDEASEYINKYSELMYSQSSMGSDRKAPPKKKNLTDKMPMKGLKFVTEKENNRATANYVEDEKISMAAKNLRNEKDILAQELINLNREITKLRTENRVINENFKRIEKERTELKKTLEIKNETLEKLRKDSQEMSLILNTDQFKTIRTIEGELRKVLGHNKELIEELTHVKKEKKKQEDELNDFKQQLDAFTEEIERKFAEEQKAEKILEENKRLLERLKETEHKLQIKDEELETKKKTVDEMLRENESLNSDIEYFKSMAKTSKVHAEKALADVEIYKNMLKKFNPGFVEYSS